MVPSPWKRPGDPRICPTRSERCSGTSRELTRRRPERVSLNEIWFALFIAVIAGYVILDGFDLGWQRGLARGRRRRSLRRVPDGLRGHVFGVLLGVDARAVVHDLANGRDRVPKQAGAAAVAAALGCGVLDRFLRARVPPRGRSRERRRRR